MSASRSRFRRYGPTLLLASAAAVAAVFAGHHYAEQQMAWELQTQARARGVEVAWEAFDLDWNGALTIGSLRAFDRRGNRAEIESVQVDWTVASVARGQVLPSSVLLTRPVVSITKPAMPPSKAPATPALAVRRGLSSLGDGPRVPWATRAIGLNVVDGSVAVNGLPGPVNKVSIEALSARADVEGKHTKATWTGVCAEGCGRRTNLSGLVRAEGKTIHAEAEAEGGFSLSTPHPSVTQARAGRAMLDHGPAGTQVHVSDIDARIKTGGWTGTVRAASVALDGDGNKRVLRPHVRLQRRAAAGGSQAAGSDPRELFDKLLSRLDGITLEDGTIEVADAIYLHRVDASVLEGRARLEAEWRGGRFAVERAAGDASTHVELDHFSLGALNGILPLPGNWSTGGAVSGNIVLEPGEQWPAAAPLVRRRYVRRVTQRQALRVTADLELESGFVFAPPVSGTPIAPGGSLHLEAHYAPAGEKTEDRLSVRKVVWATGTDAEPVRLEGVLEARNVMGGVDPLAITVDARVADVDCETALRALPAGLLPRIGPHVRATGRFAPELHFAVDLRNAWTLELELEGLPGTCALTDLGPYSPDYLAGDFQQEVREGTSKAGIMVGPTSGRWVRLKAIPPSVSAAAWMTEQVGFRHEGGLRLRHVRAALRRNFEKGRFAYGGSTIAQQLVKNLFLTRRKTLSRKLEEALIVWRMEAVIPKERILELYLNCIEFGPDVYGIAHAASYYFGKHASQLTPMEGSFLALLKPSPRSAARFKGAGATPSKGWWPTQMGYLMHRLHRRGYIGPQQVDQAAPYVLKFR